MNFRMSETMRAASVWVVWTFLALGALGWAFFVILDYFGIKERAGWAQAIGAVLAILGAAAFPYVHENDRRRQKAEGFRQLLLFLAANQAEQLEMLHKTLFNAIHDFGEHTINPYLRYGWHLKWPVHIEALRAIPIADLIPAHALMLGELKVGASYAAAVIERLDNWNVLGEREADEILQLAYFLKTAQVTVEALKGPQPGL